MTNKKTAGEGKEKEVTKDLSALMGSGSDGQKNEEVKVESGVREVPTTGEPVKLIEVTDEMIAQDEIKKAEMVAQRPVIELSEDLDTKIQEELSGATANGVYGDNPEIKNTTFSTVEKRETVSAEKAAVDQEMDMTDFIPGYGDSESSGTEAETKEKKTKEQENPLDMSKLPTSKIDHNPTADEVFSSRDTTPRVEVVSNPKLKTVGDDAFSNSIARYRQTAGKMTRVPLVNSAFKADMVGGGILDLIMLYSGNRDVNEIDYEIDKMRTILKSVTATHPNIPSQVLASAIHYVDYQMMSFGYVCGTLSEAIIPHTCEHCKVDFKISADPKDMILNLDELAAKIASLEDVTADNYHDKSLVGYVKNITFENGAKVEIGHPSYFDMVNLFNNVKYISSQPKFKADGPKYASLLSVISFIRKIIIPSGEMTTNGFQVYKALSIFNEAEFEQIKEEIKIENEKVVVPKFGIASVNCPECGKANTNIELQNLDELVFFHIMATQQTK